MTAEPDLLPLRDWMECLGEANAEDIRDYARANVAHATAPLQAEIEALRAEVERLRDGLDYLRQMQGVPDVLELRAKAARADKLAEALEDIRSRSAMNLAMHPNPFELTAMLGDIHQIADAALSKENSND